MSFPRVCGDVSVAVLDKRLREAFSPRMRGCFSDASAKKDQSKVFPAYAGMFLHQGLLPWGWFSFPRVCGDVSTSEKQQASIPGFSPRMRGCFLLSNI